MFERNSSSRIIIRICSGLIFVALCVFVTLKTYGFQLSLREDGVDVVQKSLLKLNADFEDDAAHAAVYIDDVLQAKGLPAAVPLFPGEYDLRIERKDYYPWIKRVTVEPFLVTEYDVVQVSKGAQATRKLFMPLVVTDFLLSPDEELLFWIHQEGRIGGINSMDGEQIALVNMQFACHRFTWIDSRSIACLDEARADGSVLVTKLLVDVSRKQVERELAVYPHVDDLFEQVAPLRELIVKGNYELWKRIPGEGEQFITRFSFPLHKAVFIHEGQAILLSAEKRVLLCDSEAENCVFITDQDPGSALEFYEEGKMLLFLKDGHIQNVAL